MKTQIRTDWMDEGLKPSRPGVYERLYNRHGKEPCVVLCRWDGRAWMCYGRTIDEAAEERIQSLTQEAPWRGLVPEHKGHVLACETTFGGCDGCAMLPVLSEGCQAASAVADCSQERAIWIRRSEVTA